MSLLIIAAAILGLMSLLSGERLQSTGLELLGKSRLWIAYAQGAPITSSWTPLTCRTVTFRFQGFNDARQLATRTETIAVGPASWQVVYRQNNTDIYRESWVAGDGSGPATDFDDTVGNTPTIGAFAGSGGGAEAVPGTVVFGLNSSCTQRNVTGLICPETARFGQCPNASFFSLTTNGYYGALLEQKLRQQTSQIGVPTFSPVTNTFSLTSTPKSWTVTGGSP